MPAYLCLELHYVGILRVWSAICPHASHLSDKACTHRVRVDHHLFTNSPSSHCSFPGPNWVNPVKLCSILICMFTEYVNCSLHQSLCLIQKRILIPHQVHLVKEFEKQVVNMHLCPLAISEVVYCLLRAGLTILVKRCGTIFWTSFSSSFPSSRSFIIFGKSVRESHTLLLPCFCNRTPLGLHLISACVRPFLMLRRQTPCCLTSRCLSQLGTSRKLSSLESTEALYPRRQGAFEFLGTRFAPSLY